MPNVTTKLFLDSGSEEPIADSVFKPVTKPAQQDFDRLATCCEPVVSHRGRFDRWSTIDMQPDSTWMSLAVHAHTFNTRSIHIAGYVGYQW